MNNIKIVISDLDGTLLNDQSQVSEYTKEVINELLDRGVLFVPCTGRSISQIPKWLLEHPKIKYIGSANGAMLHTDQGSKVIYQKRIDNETMRRVLENSNEYLKYSTVIFDGEYYSLKSMKEISHLYDQDYMSHVKDIMIFLDSYEDILNKTDQGIEKIHYGFPDVSSKDELLTQFNTQNSRNLFKGVSATSSHFLNIEVMHQDANKGAVAKYLLEKYNLKPENIMALGDNYNDISMLQVAGVKVAMENAEEDVKKIATHVAQHNNQDGAAKIIKQLVIDKA